MVSQYCVQCYVTRAKRLLARVLKGLQYMVLYMCICKYNYYGVYNVYGVLGVVL